MDPTQLDRILERARQNRTARQTALDKALTKPIDAEHRFGSTFFAGDRVVDTVTGQEGEVIGATRENVIVPTAQQ
jgi:hypothetical protein